VQVIACADGAAPPSGASIMSPAPAAIIASRFRTCALPRVERTIWVKT
jgi:hypothetical protein